ncbi:MFS transporter [Aeromicrobium alkaliterrae]|uniref:MFS transporter n=1 Tax=Aeromicrobium alkaliterrae TaxID=302168 RepID=A0ABP4VV29_9ACTN
MKRTLLFGASRSTGLIAAGTGLIAVTYGLVRLAYGLFLPDVQADLGLGTSTAGYVASGASGAYCLGAVAGFLGASRPRAVVVAAGACAAIGSLGMAAAPGVPVFAVSCVVGSAAAGLASPALVRLVALNIAPDRQDRAQSTVNSGTGAGLVVAGLLALVLLPQWRIAWLLVAGLALAVTAAVLRLDRGQAHPVRDEDVPSPPGRSWFRAHRHLVVAAFAMGAGSAAVWNYGRTLLTDAGASHRSSVLAWVALGVGGAVVIGTTWALGRLGPARSWALTTLAAAGGSAALAVAPQAAVIALVACGLFGWGFTAATGVLIAWTSRIDPARSPVGTSLLFVVLVLGQACGAAVTGMVAARAGFPAAFLTAAAVLVLASLLPTLVPSVRPWGPPESDQRHVRATTY